MSEVESLMAQIRATLAEMDAAFARIEEVPCASIG